MSAHEASGSEAATVPEDEVPAADGRVPGRRGRRTRDRLLSATAELLATRPYRDVTVVDIAREVGTSPATFYQYFPGVEAAVHLLARRVVEDGATLVAPLGAGRWRGREAWDASLALVDAFHEFWRDNAAVLRVIDLAIVEGDQRFRDLRDDLLGPVTEELTEAIVERRDATGEEARAEATILVSMLVHVAQLRPDFAARSPRLDTARTRLAEHVHWGVTGRRRRG